MKTNRSLREATAALLVVTAIGACTPTVRVETPDKPIEINLNVKIEQEVRIKIDKDLDAAIANDPALFGITNKKGK